MTGERIIGAKTKASYIINEPPEKFLPKGYSISDLGGIFDPIFGLRVAIYDNKSGKISFADGDCLNGPREIFYCGLIKKLMDNGFIPKE